MGLDFSKLMAEAPDKPKTVLVPPMFERDLKARSRMVKSSYDYLFAKPALRWLFDDYLKHSLNTVLLFAPSVDPRVSVKAKLSAAEPGSMSIRYQPYGAAEPLCFVDVKASPRSPGDVTLRACAFSTDTGLGTFAALPLAARASGRRAEVGVRYSSPLLTAGAVLEPRTNRLSHVWLCGRRDGVTLGLQLRPDVALHDAKNSLNGALRAAGGDVGDWLRAVSSVALSYSPAEGRTRAGQHAFTAAVEMQEGKRFMISFFQHMAAVRQVFNPMEADAVIGITNYVDVGLQLVVPLTADGDDGLLASSGGRSGGGGSSTSAAAAAAAGSGGGGGPAAGLRLAAAWQVNKNVYLKGRLGADGSVALMAAFKSWFQPSVAVAAAVERSFVSGKTRAGVTVQVENFGRLRYERSREALAHGRVLTQRHEATNAEVAMAEGDRPLLPQGARDGEFNAPEPASTTYL